MSTPNPTDGPGILVRKYGGSSIATIDRICAVARDIRAARDAGHQLVVVVSAMGGTTDELARQARQANAQPPRRELDMLLSVGERITMSLLSMALAAEGCPAISYTGSQCGIITDTSHTDARIIDVRGDRVRQSLTDGYVVVVAGFQGVSLDREITTLGRGGSDTTAVALAAALGAWRCEILKDVDGVLTADPDLVPGPRRHPALSYEQLRQIAASGCGVVHLRAVEYAAGHQVPLFVGSSFHETEGTIISTSLPEPTPQRREACLRPLALTVKHPVARLRLRSRDPRLAGQWLDLAADAAQRDVHHAEWLEADHGLYWEVLTEPATAKQLAEKAAEKRADSVGEIELDEDLGCLSLAGCGPAGWPVTAQQMRTILENLVGDEAANWPLRSDGSTLRLLIPDHRSHQLARDLHELLFPS